MVPIPLADDAHDPRPYTEAPPASGLGGNEPNPAARIERLSDFMAATMDGFLSLDRRYRFLFVNRRAAEILGVDADALIGNCLFDVRPAIVGADWEERFRTAMEVRAPVHFVEVHEALGRTFDVCIYPSADGLTASFRDITERYRAEQFKDQILAIVSHDLRHPLSAILLGAQTLLRHGHLDEADAKKTDRIVANAHRMERMITQLLDFSRASQPEGFPITTRSVDLNALVRDAVDDALSIAERRRIVVHARATNPVGRWDGDRIEQVLQNLIGNAIQHSPDDALVSVTTWDEAGGTLVVCVKNDGPVIPEARLRTIFEPFQREQPRGTRPTGLGLGLHIVRSIVRAHGGDIVATSDEHGTAFTVRLPRTRG